MRKYALEFESDLSKLDPVEWIEHLDEIAEEHGYFQPLGPDHMVCFLDAGPNLLVTFESAPAIRKHLPESAPLGFRFAKKDGWSVLSIIATGDSWFRHPAIYGYFDRLVDDGFFEDFDNVLFYGAHGGGYAASAYSVTAPGCRVLALRPQATLDPRVTGFDSRFIDERINDFTSRYGYAPDMIEGSHQAYVAFDPMQRLDAIHGALFRRKNVMQLRCPNLGSRLDTTFAAMGIHDDLIRAAMDGTITEFGFAKIMRARRSQKRFLRAVFQRCIQSEHRQLAANLCAHVLRKNSDPFFETKLKALKKQGFQPRSPKPISAAK